MSKPDRENFRLIIQCSDLVMKSENHQARHKGLHLHFEGRFKSNQISYVDYKIHNYYLLRLKLNSGVIQKR